MEWLIVNRDNVFHSIFIPQGSNNGMNESNKNGSNSTR